MARSPRRRRHRTMPAGACTRLWLQPGPPTSLLPCCPQVIMSGVEGELAAQLTRKLTQHGIPSERIMFAEY